MRDKNHCRTAGAFSRAAKEVGAAAVDAARRLPGICGLALGLGLGLAGGCKEKPEIPPARAVPVTVAPVLVRDQPIYSEYIGQTRGSMEIEIRARVEGYLESIHFQEGLFVKEGDLLYTIDPKPYEAAVAEAKGQLARAEAALANARQDMIRFEPLIERNAISRQQYDEAVANVKASQAAMESAKAAVDAARLQLGYTRITAPANGRIGKSEVQPGNLVGRQQATLLTTISTIDPIHVRFSVSEREYLEWARENPDEAQGRQATTNRFELVLADGSLYPHKGSAVFADRNVDPATGTLLIEVAFPNPMNLLRPGQYARVLFLRSIMTGAILVPQRSVQELQATYSVFVVTPENKAESRPVVPGARVGSLWVITSGLNRDETVVVEGMQKLQAGVSVQPNLVAIDPEEAVKDAATTPPSQ
jgi:membrane fusion protein, multidrug efflux system